MSRDDFYRDFEANFRGSREEILVRLQVYAPFLRAAVAQFGSAKALDLGCGRGEWLELAQSLGLSAHGVDLDEGMLADCFARGLSATKGDAIAYLKDVPDESLSVVSGFHIAEHLPFAVLRTLFTEAHRALQPGGLLILETPNAENINVGTLSFHMDPTHNKPIPPGLLSFLGRYHGFSRVQVLRLQENSELRHSTDVHLINVFQGASPDYAIVAQKAGPEDVVAAFDPAFARDHGLTIDTLANRFEDAMTERAAIRMRSEIEALEGRLGQMRAQVDAMWKLTLPVRMALRAGRKLKSATAPTLRRLLSKGRGLAMRILRIPPVAATARATARRFPAVSDLAKRLILGPRVANAQTARLAQPLGARHLSPRAAALFSQLAEQPKDETK